MRKLKMLALAIITFQNFHTYILDYLGLYKKKYELRFRNGLRIFLRGKTNDKSMAREIFLTQDYIKNKIRIKDGDIVFDIGANIGFFSLFSASAFPKCTVYSFEPNTENFAIFTQSLQVNKIKNVFSVNAALGNEEGILKLYHSRNTGGHSLVNQSGFMQRNKLEQNDFEEVKVESFRNFIAKEAIQHIDFLKMDIEGGEYDILLNLSDNDFKKIKRIAMEYHFVDENRNGDVLKKLFNHQGYHVEMEYPMMWAIRKELV